MTWKDLQRQGRVEPHVTSKAELDELRAAIGRNFEDAAIKRLSIDNRFAIAYQAALLICKLAIACAGYRVKGQGGHQTTFQALKLVLGSSVINTADYLERCRRQRNVLTYDTEGVVSATDAAELLDKAKALSSEVEVWIARHRSRFA